MEVKQKFICPLMSIRKGEFYNRMVKLFLIFLLIILSILLIIEKWIEKDFIIVFFIIVFEILFVSISYLLLIDAKVFFSIKDSRIYQCINKSELVTEIVITPHRIIFELKGMEDETLYLKNSPVKKELILLISQVFGKEKIVKNN